MRVRPLVLVFMVLLLVASVGLRAQQPVASPHGDLALDCAKCHDAQSWTSVTSPRDWKHEATGFALEGAHRQAGCRDCHRSLAFSQIATACADCHKDPHRGELGAQCERCHTPHVWTNEREMRDRHGRTRFPLTGAHTTVDCEACHRGQPNIYATTTTDCGTCHIQSYLNAKNPDHATGGFSRQCAGCHNVAATAWRPATGIDHNKTRFPLTGAHTRVSCERCHVGGRFTGTPTDCYSCHQSDYQGTQNPNHVTAGFSQNCQNCHTTDAWRPAQFDHNKTRFPLSGAHVTVDCTRCHVGGRYAGTPTDCYACHQADYNATRDPNHRTANFPTDCIVCHSTTAWKPAQFDHSRTRFPLTGAHVGVDCTRCHAGGRYTGTPTDCVACHQADYNATQNPNHRAANFPTDCITCHTTTAWQPAQFDHDGRYFPIYSGRHRGVWSSCNTCHVNPANYKVFECILCHTHDKGSTDSHHRDVSGYSYNSPSCYRCHPRGTAGD